MAEETTPDRLAAAAAPGDRPEPASFAEFWPLYLRDHSRPLTRRIHVAGTLTGAALAVAGLFAGAGLVAAGIVAGYGFAWLSHLLVEHNRPATFRHPLWSLRGDFRMTALYVSGGLEREIAHQSGPGNLP